MTKEYSLSVLAQAIKDRDSRSHDHRNYEPSVYTVKMPEVVMPKTAGVLLSTPSLWLNVDETLFTPDSLVKSLLERKDGRAIDPKLFSVFIADSKRAIAEDWGVVPSSSWNKQRFQYWDWEFVKALFTRVVVSNESTRGIVNKIAYTIRENVSLSEMKRLFDQGNQAFLDSLKKGGV